MNKSTVAFISKEKKSKFKKVHDFKLSVKQKQKQKPATMATQVLRFNPLLKQNKIKEGLSTLKPDL